MDLDLLSRLFQNLLHMDVRYFQQAGQELAGFEQKYCYHPALQHVFTAAFLEQAVAEMEERTIYELRDPLGICIHYFRFSDHTFLLGPFVKNIFQPKKVQETLLSFQLPASCFSSVELYYGAFPQLSSYLVRDTVSSCLNAFSQTGTEYAFHSFRRQMPEAELSASEYTKIWDYNAIHRRYELENNFLQLVEKGDTENVLNAFVNMGSNAINANRYLDAIYQNPSAASALVRTLARKAAEQGGASLIEIDAITRRAAQSAANTHSLNKIKEINLKTILELTEAVRRHKLHADKYSPPIQKVVAHLHLNWSQEISLPYLAELASLSEAYLSKRFRREVGMTISQFVAQLRCSEAARLLKSTSSPVSQISSYVGYLDNNYFVKVFKNQYGVTPSEYRKG